MQNDMAPYLFKQGNNTYSYSYLGAHISLVRGEYHTVFRVWAPGARSIAVVGDFNGWDIAACPMELNKENGIWTFELVTAYNPVGNKYKYRVTGKDKRVRMKADPYALYSETHGAGASVLYAPEPFSWHDEAFVKHRQKISADGAAKGHFYPAPMNIYEVHLGSWRTRDGKSTEDGQSYLNYRESADLLAPYLVEMGYTHVELMPIAEHPFDGSWGYQVCGYFAPTSRFGAPQDFKYFVDTMHKNGIGVLLDWVPAHFPKDEHGLSDFDGTRLYEYQGDDRFEQKSWGTRCFDVGRPEVQSFLISNALFWFREYHVDGLRIDAVASMLYLDYDRKPGEWIPNVNGGKENLEAVAFFQKLNTAVFAEFPQALMIAEESTAWPMVTKPVSVGGLGFNFKWNMGWANDMFDYMQTDPYFRSGMHSKLTFPMMYAYSENYILPVSHDEVVHGKKSLLDKMFGEYEDKFRAMRAFLVYMMTFPGKKMLFMGTEYAPFREWDYENQLEWFMLSYPRHGQMHRFVRDLNRLYLKTPALFEIDDGWEGFEWIDADRSDLNLISYIRRDIEGGEVYVVVNFSPMNWKYDMRVKNSGSYECIFSSAAEEYGGGSKKPRARKSVLHKEGTDSSPVLPLDVPPYGAFVFRQKPLQSKKMITK